MSLLGGSLSGQGGFERAEALLLDGYEGRKDNPDVSPERIREAVERIVDLYEAWDAAEPGNGYAEKAAEWRAKLPATQPVAVEGEPASGGE